MGVGLEITNEFGKKQIIDKAPVLVFTNKIVGANSYARDDAKNVFINEVNVYAVRPASDNYLLLSTLSFKVNEALQGPERVKYRSIGIGEFLIFKHSQPIASSNFGMEVFDENGVLQFTSNQKTLKLLDTVFINDIRTTQTMVAGRRTYWSKDYGARDIALIFIESPFWGESPHYMTVAPAKRGSVFALEAVVELTDRESVDFGGGVKPTWGLKALIIDVTGY